MRCPHCDQPVVRHREGTAAAQACPGCGTPHHVEGEGFTARPEQVGDVTRYTCMKCGHVRDVELPVTA